MDAFPYTYIKKTKDTKFNSLTRYGERSMILDSPSFVEEEAERHLISITKGLVLSFSKQRRDNHDDADDVINAFRHVETCKERPRTMSSVIVVRDDKRIFTTTSSPRSESRVIRRQPRFAYPRAAVLTGRTRSDVSMTLQREL